MLRRRGAKLTNTDLESVDFENADLSDAVLEGAQARSTYSSIEMVGRAGRVHDEHVCHAPVRQDRPWVW